MGKRKSAQLTCRHENPEPAVDEMAIVHILQSTGPTPCDTAHPNAKSHAKRRAYKRPLNRSSESIQWTWWTEENHLEPLHVPILPTLNITAIPARGYLCWSRCEDIPLHKMEAEKSSTNVAQSLQSMERQREL